MLANPPAPLLVIGNRLSHQRPESGGMVHLFQVAQFVDDDVIDRLNRGKDEAPVEVQVALKRTTPPPAFLVAHRHAPIDKTVERIEMIEPVADHFFRFLFKKGVERFLHRFRPMRGGHRNGQLPIFPGDRLWRVDTIFFFNRFPSGP